ncbi:MAG: hypothetical protein JO057_21525 [Chloroflexi bacterium]|nr:hypothetical protein [Chloroflexota bacterium]
MRVDYARFVATHWVREHVTEQPEFIGAYFTGSTIDMPAYAELPSTSDVDVKLVTASDEPTTKLGKFRYRGILLEVSHLSANQLASADDVLSSMHLASSFRGKAEASTIIADPTGFLRSLEDQVSPRFARPEWVRRRCEHASQTIADYLGAIDLTEIWPEQVTRWLFGTSLTSVVPALAALRTPTVRRRYLLAREVLTAYGYDDSYEQLLDLLGCGDLTPGVTWDAVDALAWTFDAADAVARTPNRFRSDISAAARPVAIDGSRELIRSGHHREAVFWIVATFARAHSILAVDAPNLHIQHLPAFNSFLAELGIRSTGDLRSRRAAVLAFLPHLRNVAEAILSSRMAPSAPV